MSTVTKPIALDETLQSTNTALSSLGKDTTLQAIATAIANVGLSNIGNMSSLATTDKTSLVSAINEVVGEVSDLDTDKADKVTSATNGNLAGLNASGNLTDSGWDGAKTTTSASGNPISITGLKSNQLAVNPVITFEPIQAGSGDPSPSNVRAISGYDKIEVLSCGKNMLNIPDKSEQVNGVSINIKNGVVKPTRISTSSSNLAYDLARVKLSNGTYKISGCGSVSAGAYCTLRNGITDAWIANLEDADYTLVVSGSSVEYKIQMIVTKDLYPTLTMYPMLRLGTESATFEPINKTTDISEPLPQTVYWGELDVRTGKLTVTHIYRKFNGTENWTWYSASNSALLNDALANRKGIDTTNKIYGISNMQATSSDGSINSDVIVATAITMDDLQIRQIGTNFGVSDVSLEGWKTWLATNNLEFTYELATPITIQLTPHEISLLKDYAYVSTNGTSIALDYHNGEIATLGNVAQLGETVNELGDYLRNDVESVDNATVNSWKQSNISVAYGALTRVGRMVTINISWIGDISDKSPIVVIPEKYRPSKVFMGGHLVYITAQSEYKPGIITINADGQIYDDTTAGAKTKGLLNITYYI